MAELSTLRVSDERNWEATPFTFCEGAQHPPKADAPAWQDLQFFPSAFRSSSNLNRRGSAVARFFVSLCRKDPV